MSEPRVLYVVYVPLSRERTILDAMRLFARPQAKHPAHITVRGPYPDYRDPREWTTKIRGKAVSIEGVGTFVEKAQNTVFLRASSAAIRALWDKPDYPDYNPHITIYDGPSRHFAEAIRDLLVGKNIRFSFTATAIEPVVVGNGTVPLIACYESADLAAFLDVAPSATELAHADEESRLSWISRLADHLPSAKAVIS